MLRKPLARETDDQNGVRRRNTHAHHRTGQRRNRQRPNCREQHPDDARESSRKSHDDDQRIRPRLEVDDDQQVYKHDRPGEVRTASPSMRCSSFGPVPDTQLLPSADRLWLRPRSFEYRPRRRRRSRPSVVVENLHHRLDVILRNDCVWMFSPPRSTTLPSTCGAVASVAVIGKFWSDARLSSEYCGVCMTIGYDTPFFGPASKTGCSGGPTRESPSRPPVTSNARL